MIIFFTKTGQTPVFPKNAQRILFFIVNLRNIDFCFYICWKQALKCDFSAKSDHCIFQYHTCQLSPINRDSPDFGTISRSLDLIWKISRFSRFWNHPPITFFIAKIENKAIFFILFLRMFTFFQGEGRSEEGFYTTISWFSSIGCVNYAWRHR